MEDKPRQALEKIKVRIELLIQSLDESLIQINKFEEVNKNGKIKNG
jgi:hypothetical protein